MDLAAFDLCRQHEVAVLVFDIHPPGNLKRAIEDPSIGTLITTG